MNFLNLGSTSIKSYTYTLSGMFYTSHRGHKVMLVKRERGGEEDRNGRKEGPG